MEEDNVKQNDLHRQKLAVYPWGTDVTCDNVNMVIVRIEVCSHGVSYFCEWWDDSTLCGNWFPDWRVKSVNGNERLEVGFRKV